MTTSLQSRQTPETGKLADDAPHVLVVDDDQRIADLLKRYLLDNGFRVSTAKSAEQAKCQMRGLRFDVIVLDVMMPGQSGFEFAQELRKTSQIPILMLTALSETDQRIKGLEIGVNDYLGKPFEPRELVLRLQNILQTAKAASTTPQQSGEVRMGKFRFDIGRGVLLCGNEPVRITDRERELLRQFCAQPGVPIARDDLASDDSSGSSRAVDVQINRLRRKIEPDPSNPIYLQTVRGKGYVLQVD